MNEIQIFWATLIGLPILAACATVAMPSVRQEIKQDYKRWRMPLEQRYAKEIAAGEITIIKASPQAKRNMFLLIVISVMIILFGVMSMNYLADAKDECVDVLGVNASIFLFLINLLGLLLPVFSRSLSESFSARFEKKYPLFGDQVVHHTTEKAYEYVLSFKKRPIASSLAVIFLTLLSLQVHKPHLPCAPQINAASQSS